VRLATFNLLSGRGVPDGVVRTDDLRTSAQALDADVVGLQEVDRNQDRSGGTDQTAVVGPLATYAEPHSYDLCEIHGERLSAPRGWEVLRLAPDPSTLPPSTDDLLALADAVREAGRPMVAATRSPSAPPVTGEGRETARRGHLRMLTSE